MRDPNYHIEVRHGRIRTVQAVDGGWLVTIRYLFDGLIANPRDLFLPRIAVVGFSPMEGELWAITWHFKEPFQLYVLSGEVTSATCISRLPEIERSAT